MKPNFLSKAVLLSTLALMSMSPAFAGQEGHGGVVVKCNDQIELADFWEAKVMHKNDQNFKLSMSEESVNTQVVNAFTKLSSYRASTEIGLTLDVLMSEYKKILDNTTTIEGKDVYWQYSNDVGLFRKLPENCQLDNVIHYLRDNYIDKRQDYYEILTKTEKAALWVHEVVYKLSRNAGQKNSQAARRITAFLFSNLNDQEIASGLILGFLSNKEVVFADRKEARTELKTELANLREGAQNHAHIPFFDSGFNLKTKCEQVPRRIQFLGTKEECTTIEEETVDFDILKTITSFVGISGTSVDYEGSIILNLKGDEILNKKIKPHGTTGKKQVGYAAGTNVLRMINFFYVASEKKTFDYLYGRFQ